MKNVDSFYLWKSARHRIRTYWGQWCRVDWRVKMKRKNACASFSDEWGYLLGFRFREMVPDYEDDATFDLPCFARWTTNKQARTTVVSHGRWLEVRDLFLWASDGTRDLATLYECYSMRRGQDLDCLRMGSEGWIGWVWHRDSHSPARHLEERRLLVRYILVSLTYGVRKNPLRFLEQRIIYWLIFIVLSREWCWWVSHQQTPYCEIV